MKKNFYSLFLMAVALFSAVSMVSCSKDEEKQEEKQETKHYARYIAKISEDIFTYFDVTITIEADGKPQTYKLGENTKVADLKIETAQKIVPGRVLEVPAFAFSLFPLKFKTDLQLTEAGKQKIANATTEEMDFIASLEYGKCDEKGIFTYDGTRYVKDEEPHLGVYLKTFDEFYERFMKNHAKNFDMSY